MLITLARKSYEVLNKIFHESYKKLRLILKKNKLIFNLYRGFLSFKNSLSLILPWRKYSPDLQLFQSGNYTGKPFKRSVIFMTNSYYHNYYLAQALRRRNWDVLTVSMEDPKSSSTTFYHGEDINLFDPDPQLAYIKQKNFYEVAKDRYAMLHISNDHYLSFFSKYALDDNPKDIIEWKKLGKKIAYTISGCNSGILPSSIDRWSGDSSPKSVCSKCIWKDNVSVCSDKKSHSWIDRIEKHIDLTFAETLPPLDYIASTAGVMREPVVMCLDPIVWRPNLDIPPKYIINRNHKDEILVYHGVGNHSTRTSNTGQNIKGTHAILLAIERLNAEGIKVQIIQTNGSIPNRDVRFLQSQADIVIEQLNFGCYGATARESMMLGIPVISRINKYLSINKHKLHSLEECPVVNATENNIYDVLKDLVLNRNKRESLGKLSREYALKWHSADACAERYEKIYDQIMSNEDVSFPENWEYFDPQIKNASTTNLHNKNNFYEKDSVGAYIETPENIKEEVI